MTLTATPTAGSTFAGWSGGGCSGTGSCVVALSAAQTVTATFGIPTPQAALSLTLTGTGGGTIAWSAAPAGSCVRTALSGTATSCTPSFDVGTAVTLTATPATPGSYFVAWAGDCFGSAPTCSVSMSAARSVTASFQYDVSAPTLTVSGIASGAAYVTHPNITLAYADDIGFGAAPLRITWSRQTPANALVCFVGLDGGSAPIFAAATGSTCSARNVGGVGAIAAAGAPAGTYTLTIQSVDMAGNVSTPVTRTYTVGM
ncbi:hypothetical protein rosag_15130 [Roseisolibacter agri]|uniref:Bacterial repeat domain-containing protein n=1 Tax=Roseisolibacter agri TaxID=2014610 RepID=A0AA37V0Q9_9BACT|nr:hypothetical protein rosag_15130 [Roseisolibacter agri]